MVYRISPPFGRGVGKNHAMDKLAVFMTVLTGPPIPLFHHADAGGAELGLLTVCASSRLTPSLRLDQRAGHRTSCQFLIRLPLARSAPPAASQLASGARARL